MKTTLSILVESEDQLLGKLASGIEADYLELRLDLAPELDWTKVLAQSSTPIVATCMPKREGGRGKLSNDERHLLLRRAVESGCELVDWPHDEDVPTWALDAKLIHSWHQAHGSAFNLDELLSMHKYLSAKSRPQDFVKLVVGDSQDACLSILGLYSSSEHQAADYAGLLAFAQGAKGTWTRLAVLKLGSPWIYCADDSRGTAPGQLTSTEVLGLPIQEIKTCNFWGVVGSPVMHSLSPLLWNKAFSKEGIKSVYCAVDSNDLGDFIDRSPPKFWSGFSITMPLKEQAFHVADAHCEVSSHTQSVNCLLPHDGECNWIGLNTDGYGAMASLREKGIAEKASILVLGGGGAARSLMLEAKRQNFVVSCALRSPTKIERFTKEHQINLTSLADVDVSLFDAVVQSTPVGSDRCPGLIIDCPEFSPQQIVMDMVYSPVITDFLAEAYRQGAIIQSGGQMLLHQMIAQYRAGVNPNPNQELVYFLTKELANNVPGGEPIFLCGPRASGKSSLGRALAAKLDHHYFDADDLIARRHSRDIADWIANDLNSFREAESELLKEFSSMRGAVIGLGGGVVESHTNREFLVEQERVFFLEIDLETQLKRQKQAPRPALTALNLEQEIAELYERRYKWYLEVSNHRVLSTAGDFETVLSLLHTMVC